MNKVSVVEEWTVLLGGTLAVTVSVTLFLWLVIRPDASINPLNAVTLILGLTGGTVALAYPDKIRLLAAATLILILAAAPTVFGAVWLLYVPPITLVALGATVKVLRRFLGNIPK